LCIDDFSSGDWSQSIGSLNTWFTGFQSGTMLGGWRTTSIISNSNPDDMPLEANIRGTSRRLALSSGAHAGTRLDLYYGFRPDSTGTIPVVNPLRLDLSRYDRLRVSVGYNDLGVNPMLQVVTSSGVLLDVC
jgi:hypothetical protein